MTKVEITDIGDTVLCDYCNEDYTNSDAKDGIYFGGKAVCPLCLDRTMKSIKKYHEERFITATCPKGKSFADWVREDLRGGKPGIIKKLTF